MMSYQLYKNEPLRRGIQRIAYEQIDRALEQLFDWFEGDRNEVIHDVRKRLKKVRAVLRLVRNEIGDSCYQRENINLRDIGRRFAHVRDAKVRIETLDNLHQHFEGLADIEIVADVRHALEEYYASTWRYVLDVEQAITPTIDDLKGVRNRIEDWPIDTHEWSVIESGLKQTYKRGDRALANLSQSSAPEDFHEWRKRVKYLWYHLSILRPLWPGVMTEWADQTHQLSRLLGDEHDLTVLRGFITSDSRRLRNLSGLSSLTALIDCQRHSLRLQARGLGARIYAEEPKSFIRRLEAYWTLWQQEQQIDP